MAAASVSQTDVELKHMGSVEIHRRFNKARWVTISKLYYTLSRYGLPYGGAVRDYITRTSAADSYYAYCKENDIDADANYNNREVHSESYSGRSKLPCDIDVFITRKQFDALIKDIGSRFNMKKKGVATHNYFFKSCKLLKEAITHEKWTLNLFTFSYDYVRAILWSWNISKKHYELPIDFIIINDDYLQNTEYINRGILYPPFGNPDFDVNLLSFTINKQYQLEITPLPYLKQLHHAAPTDLTSALQAYESNKIIMDSVITNIKKKLAQPVFPIKELYTKVFGESKAVFTNGYRIIKMHDKKYKIDYYNTILPTGTICFWQKDNSGLDAEVNCTVCKESFTNENRAFNACSNCPRKMHLKCLCDFLEKANASDAPQECLQCTDCGSPSFPDNCPCELTNFLYNILYFTDTQRTRSIINPCKGCNEWYDKCKCWFLKCKQCKKQLEVSTDAPAAAEDKQ